MTTVNNLLDVLLTKYTINELTVLLNVSKGTINRWIEKGNVPELYKFELMKLLNIDINYNQFNYKEKDQFFTPENVAKNCYNKAITIINNYEKNIDKYIFIEPSAGGGSFFKHLPEGKRIGLDIEPRSENIIRQDFLNWMPKTNNGKYIVIGNPPFGLRGHMALKFINHSAEFAEYVCFILPQLFESDGKGVPRKRVSGLNLIYSEKLNNNFNLPDGKDIKIKCIFQIWSKNNINDKYKLIDNNNDKIKVYSLSDGGTSSSTRNKNMLANCDIYVPSTCYGKENMRYYETFEELPNRKGYGIVFNENKKEQIRRFKNINWTDVAFLSTNSAYNLRTNQIIEQFL